MHDLLEDPLIGIRTKNGTSCVSLPELLTQLCNAEVEGYTGLRPHQADPWHAFLVQLAASILARHPKIPPTDPPGDVNFWRAGLLDLAEGKASAWHLAVEDVTQPAFLQHPLAGAEELTKEFKPKAAAPDELDVLVTAKNHDVKMARAASHTIDAWLFALLTYQTTSGFLGAGNYGIVRMNGGFASRPFVSMLSNTAVSPRFREELALVCNQRPELLKASWGYSGRGIALTWLTPWRRDGHCCNLSACEPFFVEAARPLRLIAKDGTIIALGTTSGARLIGPKSIDNGDVGDPWIPLNVEDKKKGQSALTISGKGWTPELLVNLLFQRGYRLTPLQMPRAGNCDLWFIGSALVRGQGTTDGFHRFEIPIPAKASSWLMATDKRKTLGELAQELIKAAKAADKALSAALIALAEGGPEEVNFKADSVVAWTSKAKTTFSRGWEDSFFKSLWRAASEDSDNVRRDWERSLVELAKRILRDAEGALPMPHGRRYRALVAADRILFGSLKKSGLIHIDTEEVA